MPMNRRSMLGRASAIAIGGSALLRTGSLSAAVEEAKQSVAGWPKMTYRTLGNTGFEGSRLVFGCGGALAQNRALHLLEPALEAGVNVFDSGYRGYYRDAEVRLAPFLKAHRDEIFLISKARAANADFGPGHELTDGRSQGRRRVLARGVGQQLKGVGC